MFFRIKRSTQLRKLMNAYCDRQSVDINSIAFLFDGRRLRGEQTPDEVNKPYYLVFFKGKEKKISFEVCLQSRL